MHELAIHTLAHPAKKKDKPEPKRHLKSSKVAELHSGGYTVTHDKGDGSEPEVHGAPDIESAQSLMAQHMEPQPPATPQE